MGLKSCRETISRFPTDKVFTSLDVSDDTNVHGYLARMCKEGFIVRLPEKVKMGGRNPHSQYRRVSKGFDVVDPFEPWKAVWPEMFMFPTFTGVKHRYVQEL